MPFKQRVPDPTRSEILERTAAIRKGWDGDTEFMRIHPTARGRRGKKDLPAPCTAPEYRFHQNRKTGYITAEFLG